MSFLYGKTYPKQPAAGRQQSGASWYGEKAVQIILSRVNMLFICFVTGICLHGQSWRCSESGWLNRTPYQATEAHSFSRQGAVKIINKKGNVACKVYVN